MADEGDGRGREWKPACHRASTPCLVLVAGALLAGVWGLYGVYVGLRHHSWETGCRHNLREVYAAIRMYCADYDSHLPRADNWSDEVDARIRTRQGRPQRAWYDCPALPGDSPGYCLNAALAAAGLKSITDPGATVLVFDGPAGWNTVGGPEDVQYRHRASGRCAFFVSVDGSAGRLDPGVSDPARWEP